MAAPVASAADPAGLGGQHRPLAWLRLPLEQQPQPQQSSQRAYHGAAFLAAQRARVPSVAGWTRLQQQQQPSPPGSSRTRRPPLPPLCLARGDSSSDKQPTVLTPGKLEAGGFVGDEGGSSSSSSSSSPPTPSPTAAGERDRVDLAPLLVEASSSSNDHKAVGAVDPSSSSSSSSFRLPQGFAYLLLNAVTVLWGTQHAVIKSTLLAAAADGHTGAVNALRFGLASLLFLPWTPSLASQENREGIWRAGAELGLWMFAGYALQAVGLESTTAARSGFLLYLNVKLVPLFAWAFLGRRPTVDVWASAFTAFVGTALLAFDGGALPNIGDFWSLLAAAASAMFILRLEGAAKAYAATASKELNAVTLWTTAALCLLWAGGEFALEAAMTGGGGGIDAAWASLRGVVEADWRQIVYLAVVTTALCNWIQTLGQREVPAEKAALIYALDPVYGAAFARLLLGDSEALGATGYVGGALVTAAALFSTLYSAGKDNGGKEEGLGESGADDGEIELGAAGGGGGGKGVEAGAAAAANVDDGDDDGNGGVRGASEDGKKQLLSSSSSSAAAAIKGESGKS